MSSLGNGSLETQPNRSEQQTTESSQFTIFPEHLQYKNRLQEYTQRSSVPLPLYQTTNEGAQHAPRFRSTVLVDGSYYTSPNTFPLLKAAEQDVARVALDGISLQIKDEGCPLICEDTVFCKSILNEYAVKMKLEIPSYKTVRQEGLLPVFISSLVFNGVEYTGNAAKNKKQAEQLAARAVILSLWGHSSFGTGMSEIVKSKNRLYAAVHKVEDSPKSGGMPLHKVTEVEVVEGAHNIPITTVSDTCLGQLTTSSGAHSPLHEFKKPKLNPTSEPIAPPIEFVSQPPPVEGSISGKKRSRYKKKAKMKLRGDAP